MARYITAEDVGTTVADMDFIHEETNFVTGISPEFGSSGNPSPVTAYGVYRGMKAAAKEAFGSDSLEGKDRYSRSRKCRLYSLSLFT